MPVQKPTQALDALQSGNYSPVYFLHGSEPYYTTLISHHIETHALPENEKSFNQLVLYGRDTTMGEIVNQARRFPMMAARQVVIVKELQELPDLRNEAAQSLLQKYVAQPLPSTILVLCYQHKPFDKRKALYKTLEKNAVVVESKPLYDNQLPQWVEQLVKEKGHTIHPQAIHLLVESIGNRLDRLQKELDKIVINLKTTEEITVDLVQEFVGISKEYNVFELQKALTQRDILKANKIINFFASNAKDHPLIPIIAVLYQFFSRLLLVHHTTQQTEAQLAQLLGVNPYFVKDYMQAARQYKLAKVIQVISFLRIADLQAKGVAAGSMDEEAILKELIFKILH